MANRRLVSVAAVTLLVVLSLGHLAGFRWNVAHAVAAPPDDASAPEVTLAYLTAFNQRDFRLARRLYPGSTGYSRVRPMGHDDDVQTTRLLAERPDGEVRTVATDRHQTLVWVMVSYTAAGFTSSDWAVRDGPGGTGYKLSREDPDDPWRIIDAGTP